ncbi:DUF4838 domain-containing protein [Gimesia sp.]|uniref:DUF4838 domain-containing protein n=1 Tax=Gimesia sp. TaxID=2024833 RepID=UPI000C389D47|nr:DUF4838 domain-containing protein [Gimesia sp.]MAX40076.1 hypothetical protein [Gimesia sp.]HBL47822.1 hypothetical protein [Planctomycetaceae bacterium]|tara:strand:+ start:573 stop:3161 length:2589 start_codon:yes stop_codon:yes gene_type:complete
MIQQSRWKRVPAFWFLSLFAVFFYCSLLPAEWKQAACLIAENGNAKIPIVVSETASERTRKAADDLAHYLSEITGASFSVKTGNGSTGLAVGLLKEFPQQNTVPELDWKNLSIKDREKYCIRSHKNGIYLFGITDLAVEHAVWDFLYRIGYRQYFPGSHWEVIPRQKRLQINLDVIEAPDYQNRIIWYGFGPWDYAAEPYRLWCQRNRATSGMALKTGHSYGQFIRNNQAEFDAHPEYYALVDGRRDVRSQAKFCISNSGLQKLIVDSSLRYFEDNPEADSISLDPSDGGGWCECEACQKMGSISDRALTLANQVAAAINNPKAGSQSGHRYVGMYAYAYHSPPPAIKVHPNVIISVATGFLRGGNTLDEIINGWSKQGARIGIREYYSVYTWDHDMPGLARGSRIDYLKSTIPRFHQQGAQYMSAESSDNWGPNGLGYYLAARMLWNLDEAQKTDQLTDDFLTLCFNKAKAPMTQFYEQLDGSHSHLVVSDQYGRMFRSLAEAKKLAEAPEVHARLDDLILYCRYVDLYERYRQASGTKRQQAFEQLIRHSYRMRKTMLVHSKAVYRDAVNRDKSVTIPENAQWNIPEPQNPWKESTPFSKNELQQFLEEGIAAYPLTELDFKPITYSDDLVPAGKIDSEKQQTGVLQSGRGVQTFYTYVSDTVTPIELQVTGGLIAHYRDRGNVKIELWKIGGASQTGERETFIMKDQSVPPDGKTRTVQLAPRETGMYRITVSDGGDRTSVNWKAGQRMVMPSSLDEPLVASGRWSLFFYVPQGAKVVGFHGGNTGSILDPTGKEQFSLKNRKMDFYSIPVPAGSDGKLWKVNQAAGAIRLLTVPPYFTRSASELLLPREVLQTDSDLN